MTSVQDRTFDFAVRIIGLCTLLERTPGVSRTLSRQFSRSGTSVGANMREALGAQSPRDYIAKVYISLKEAHETLYWLDLIETTGIVPSDSIQNLAGEANEIIGILTGTLKTAKKRNGGYTNPDSTPSPKFPNS